MMDVVNAGQVVWAVITWRTQKKIFVGLQIFASEADARRVADAHNQMIEQDRRKSPGRKEHSYAFVQRYVVS